MLWIQRYFAVQSRRFFSADSASSAAALSKLPNVNERLLQAFQKAAGRPSTGFESKPLADCHESMNESTTSAAQSCYRPQLHLASVASDLNAGISKEAFSIDRPMRRFTPGEVCQPIFLK